jgi:hypothetical protein
MSVSSLRSQNNTEQQAGITGSLTICLLFMI